MRFSQSCHEEITRKEKIESAAVQCLPAFYTAICLLDCSPAAQRGSGSGVIREARTRKASRVLEGKDDDRPELLAVSMVIPCSRADKQS